MTGIYLIALLTTFAALAILVPLIQTLPMPADRRLLWLAAAITLPLQPLAFYLLRLPLDHWLSQHLGSTSSVYQWLTSLYAPLTEEPAKLVPLLIPAIYKDITRKNYVRYALAIGLGFAIGEMWFIADRLARVPAYANLPFHQFGGYFGERLMTCFFHGAFVAAALSGLRRYFAATIVLAMALHWLGNFPILLKAWNTGDLGNTTWMIIVQLWLVFYFLVCLALLATMAFGRFNPTRLLYGRRRCPSCQQEYDPSLLGLNFGSSRYERCPHCRRWHWTKPQPSAS